VFFRTNSPALTVNNVERARCACRTRSKSLNDQCFTICG